MPRPDPRVEYIEFTTSDGVRLFFRRGMGGREGTPVLVLHGASASCDTFLSPPGASLFDFLNDRHGMDVWLLDWRGSHYIAETQAEKANASADVVASIDIPEAVALVCAARRVEQISILAHCFGAACLAMAIGGDHLRATSIRRLVLATIGLFYEVPWDGWTKTQDRVLDRVASQTPVLSLNPDVNASPWPLIIEETFGDWPKTWGPPWPDKFFQRLAFLFGQPFLVSNLHEAMTPARVKEQFGAVPFKLFQHGGQNTLRGFAARFDAEGQLPPNVPNSEIGQWLARDYLQLDRFEQLDITLLTGADNPLWHRDSIDRMAEWLARRGRAPRKLVLADYGHQDLWWGRTSWNDVFPLVHNALR